MFSDIIYILYYLYSVVVSHYVMFYIDKECTKKKKIDKVVFFYTRL